MVLDKLFIYIASYIGLFIAIFYLLVFFETKQKKNFYNNLKTNFPSITIIIPAYNEEKTINKTIKSTLKLKYPKKFDIFVVDDGSTDKTPIIVKKLSKKYKNVKLFRKKNGGKADAINFGIKKTKTELIAVLDADTFPKRDALEKGIEYFKNPKIMAVTCRTIPINKKNFLCRMQYVEYLLSSFFRNLLASISALQVVPAFSIFRHDFFKKYGMFEVGNITEDIEMGLRIKKYGYDVAYIVESYAKTEVPETLADLKKQRVRWGYGLIQNIIKYKQLFSPRYGDLGLFFMPVTMTGILILLLFFLYTLNNIYVLLYQQISSIKLGGLSIFFFNIFNLNWNNIILIISDPRVIIGMFGFLFALTIFYLVRITLEKKLNFLDYLKYIFLYSWILMYFNLLAVIQFFIKKPNW